MKKGFVTPRNQRRLPGKKQSSTHSSKTNQTPLTETSIDDEENFDSLDKEFSVNPESPKKSISFFGLIGKMMLLIMQAFAALCIIPIFACIVAFAVLFGIEIYLLILGSSVFGFVLITFALIWLLKEIASLIWKLVGHSKRKLSSYGLNLIVCAILFGAGTMFSVRDISKFEIQDVPLTATGAMTHSFVLPIHNVTKVDFKWCDTRLTKDENINKDTMVIHVTAPELFQIYDFTKIDSIYHLNYQPYSNHEFEWIQVMIELVFDGLKNNILYQFDSASFIQVEVFVHPDNFKNLTINESSVIIQ